MKHCHKKKSTITIKHYTNSSELPVEWNDFIPEGHFLQSKQLGITESANLPDLSYCYVQVFNNNEPVLAAGFQLLSLKSKHVNPAMIELVQQMLWRAFTIIAHPKLLVGGHLFRHDVTSVYCGAEIPVYDTYLYYKQAIDHVMDLSCASAVVIKDMPEKLAKYFQNYEPQYIMLRNDISMEMNIPAEWNDIHDYEKALKHKYAQRFRKIQQPFASLDIKELSSAEVEENKHELFALYQQVTDHQQVRIGLLSSDFLPVLKRHNEERLKVWTGYEHGNLLGFFSAWVHNGAFDMFYIGFDYEKNKELNLYFNILYFAIEQAILMKKNKLILGRTALDAKARLGCTPRYLSTFVYIKNRFVRQRVMQAQKNIDESEGAWESRHPFKNQQP
ncbi:MAG: hypothetical protein KDC07_00405 [Chitinophagaceae bacterium]|nr:hypothetical protein [Chitinophagaceae bacterium]MCB9044838.1 hypothetical protein [Chitinophagales bacterium]